MSSERLIVPLQKFRRIFLKIFLLDLKLILIELRNYFFETHFLVQIEFKKNVNSCAFAQARMISSNSKT